MDKHLSKSDGYFQGLFSHFKELPDSSRALIRSFGSFYLAVPLFSTFTSAFLWEQADSKLAVPYFYLGIYPGLAVGFYLSAIALRFLTLQQLYALGLVTQAVPILALCFIRLSSLPSLCVMGAIWGIFAGLYWSARNLLTLQLTHDAHRDYFFGTDSFLSVTASTIFPILFGILIEYRFFLGGTLDKRGAFTILMVLLIAVLSLGARGILRANLGTVRNVSPLVRKPPEVWWVARKLIFVFGMGTAALSFIPAILVLSHFKGQAQLGGLQSCAALLSAALLYRLGTKISTPQHRVVGMTCATLSLLIAAALLEIGIFDWNVLLFAIVAGFTSPFNWNCINSALLRAIEASDPGSENSFGYLCDREAFLDAGRSVGIGVALIVAIAMGIEEFLTIVPILAAAWILVAVLYLKRLSKFTEYSGHFTVVRTSSTLETSNRDEDTHTGNSL